MQNKLHVSANIYSNHQVDYRAKNEIFIVAFCFCIQSDDGCVFVETRR